MKKPWLASDKASQDREGKIMTFTVIEQNGKSYFIDLESLDELVNLAEHYGWATIEIDMLNMTIKIDKPAK